MNFIDLGLPSGTLWADANENGFYTFDEAVKKYSKNIPNREQFEELKDQCQWEWIGNGYRVTGPNGNSITLQASGYCHCSGSVYYVGSYGDYWSSTPDDLYDTWSLHFERGCVDMYVYNRYYGKSVRLIKKKENGMENKKQHLLMQDLCARLPYGVYIKGTFAEYDYDTDTLKDDVQEHQLNISDIEWLSNGACNDIKPYLRSMEDMTEEDMEDFARYQFANDDVYGFLYAHKTGKGLINVTCTLRQCTDQRHVLFQVNKRTTLRDGWRGIDWLNAHHFDYRGLIEQGLAIRVTKENNPYRN